MKQISLFLILILLSCQSEPEKESIENYKLTPQQENERQVEQAIHQELSLNRKRQVYVGYEKMENLSKYEKLGANDKWLSESRLFLKGDSAFLDISAIVIRNGDTLHSSSDGGFYYYKGTFDSLENKIEITLDEIDRDYALIPIKKENGMEIRIFDKKNLIGKVQKGELLLNDIIYTLKVDSNILLSMFFTKGFFSSTLTAD